LDVAILFPAFSVHDADGRFHCMPKPFRWNAKSFAVSKTLPASRMFCDFRYYFHVFFPFAIFSKICQPTFGKNISRIGKILNSGPALEPRE
jgi:hypothetical protein